MSKQTNTPAADVQTVNGVRYARTAQITLPDMVMEENDHPYLFTILTPFVQGRAVENDQGVMQSPPTKCHVLDLTRPQTGPHSLLVPAMVRNRIEEAFPGDKYVTRSFEVIMRKGPKGKRYRLADVYEIDAETGGATEA